MQQSYLTSSIGQWKSSSKNKARTLSASPRQMNFQNVLELGMSSPSFSQWIIFFLVCQVFSADAKEFFKDQQDYVSKVAKTEKEVCKLIEAGFEYVTDFEDAKIFKKRKI